MVRVPPQLRILALAFTGVVACASRAPASGRAEAPLVQACPLGVRHTRISIEDTESGVSVVFSTRREDVATLRQRVRDQAERRGPGAHLGPGHGGRHGVHHEHGLRLWSLPPSTIEVLDVPRGASIRLVPRDPRTRDELRLEVVRRVAALEARGCPD